MDVANIQPNLHEVSETKQKIVVGKVYTIVIISEIQAFYMK